VISAIGQADFTSAMRSAYGAKENGIGQHPATIIVDVANVMGSRPDGWWRDRAGAAVRLHADIAALAAKSAALAASGHPILPDEPDPPRFVMVLEGAARAAAARIRADDGQTRADDNRTRADDGQTRADDNRTRADDNRTRAEDNRTRAGDGQTRADDNRTRADDGPVRVVQADGSGDDAIVALARELPGRRFVVTADRELQRRCVAAGAAILRPGWLLGLVHEALSGRPARSTGRPHSPSRPRRARRRSEHRSRQ
jgi:8-oxo-dGTP diphosphatase